MSAARASRQSVPTAAIVFFVIGLTGTGSDDLPLTVACGFVAATAVLLLWRVGESPALLLAAGMQLIQVITPRLYANVLGVPIQDVSLEIGDLTLATWFALGAMLSLITGMWCGQLGSKPRPTSALQLEAQSWNPISAFWFCVVSIVLATVFEGVANTYSGLSQIAHLLSGIQWVGVFVLACVCFVQLRGAKYLVAISCFLALKGFMGFFSEYKMVFIVILAALMSARPRFRPIPVFIGLLLVSILLAMSVFWSAIKTEYRYVLNQGSGEQVVSISLEERVSFLEEKLQHVDWDMMSFGLDRLISRMGYLDYLARTLSYVPQNIEFQDGAQIGATVMHVLQPRLLYPDKPPLPSDTEITAKYTGLQITRGNSKTSIGIGYVGELYIDFGISGVLIGAFLMGFVYGRAFRFTCALTTLPPMVCYALSLMLMLAVASFEMALAKTIGGFLTTLIAVVFLVRFLLPSMLRGIDRPKSESIDGGNLRSQTRPFG
jgi:hypothetical protein